jgi:O-methyltransferase
MTSSLVGPESRAALEEMALGAPPGALVEIGVYLGGTAVHLHRAAVYGGRALHLFDTFAGIPVAGPNDRHKVGEFCADEGTLASLVEALHGATFHVGTYPDTDVDIGPVALLHLDCDQEETYREALERFWPRLVSGGIVVCDDYEHLPGAKIAVDDFAREHGVAIRGADTPQRAHLVKA